MFNIYRKDRFGIGQGQGVLVLVNSKLRHDELTLPTLNTVEAADIRIYIKSKPISVIGIYNSPSVRTDTEDIRKLSNVGQAVIIAGDYNSKHPVFCSRRSNDNGKVLNTFLQSSQLQILSQHQPTHYPTNGNQPDVLGYALHKNINQYLEIKTEDEFVSDHQPIFIEFKSIPDKNETNTYRDGKNANWKLNHEVIKQDIPGEITLNTYSDIDKAVETITLAIQHATEIAVPHRTNKEQVPKLPKDIINLI